MKGYYCIALSDYKGNLLDIYESRFLRTGNIQTDNVYIVGVASDKTMYLNGIGKYNNELVSLLNIDSVLGVKES